MKKLLQRKTKTMDGNQAAAHVAYAYTEVAPIYPITPSSTMAEYMEEWALSGRENILGDPVTITQMQSEAGAAGTLHGSLIAGALSTTFTASQGLLLMLPNIYRIAGELLPGVFYVAARTIATHALSIFGDHSDIYACRQSGAAFLAHSSVQEVMDLSPVAHLSALKGRIPFINFFDGFRTSHEIQKVEIWDYTDLKELFDEESLKCFRDNALHPHHGKLMGAAENPDIFFQHREASNPYYQALPGIVEESMEKINDKLGTTYGLFDYIGSPDAEHIIVAMGSVCETIEQTISHLQRSGKNFGLIKVRLYRPFSNAHFLAKLPKSTKQITVLDRTKEPGSNGEPLYLDVLSAIHHCDIKNITVYSGRYGLSSKDTTPQQILAVLENTTQKRFTIGIEDDVTHLSLPVTEYINPLPSDIFSCKIWGLGGDGTVSANKSTIKIIGDHTDMHVQAYFEYDSKKSRGLTISHLRFGKSPIHAPYLVQTADLVACHNPSYLHKFDIVEDLKDGGILLLNCYWKEQDLDQYLPKHVKQYIFEHRIRLYIIDAMEIGKEIGLNSRISTILQAAFFRLINLLPAHTSLELMKKAADISYGKKGNDILQMNYTAIERGFSEVKEVQYPQTWSPKNNPDVSSSDDASASPEFIADHPQIMDYVEKIQRPISLQKGNDLPVSAFLPYADGSVPSGLSAHERRNISPQVPVWIPENCIQCNRCSFVCPHAVIRPVAMNQQEMENAPASMHTLPMIGIADHHFAITVSEVDCTGCGACVGICPGKLEQKALQMVPVHEKEERQKHFDYGKKIPPKPDVLDKFKTNTVKGSQFLKPYLEFHGACAGCGETTYPRLITQLFGDHMYIANATGCSSIWANSSPSSAYTIDASGRGPAWSNSLFEDASEFGYGMLLAGNYLHPDQKLSYWVLGGDGFAYDIGFGGLDHVLASGANINILIMDTEGYSNTGGQASKATPLGSTAKFASGGKFTRKKDLATMFMTYGDVYVAQIAMGADFNQTLKAILEAESYQGPSILIAYSPCISHGVKAGMGCSPHEEAKAVKTGYWHLFRYNPALKNEGKNPFVLDSKEPALNYDEFLAGETRYTILENIFPETAADLFALAERDAKARYEKLLRLQKFYEP